MKELEDIITNSLPYARKHLFKSTSGVYFLIKDNTLIYVGRTKDLCRRLNAHIYTEMREFDRFYFIEMDYSTTREIEAGYIAKFKPRENTILNPDTFDLKPMNEGSEIDVESLFNDLLFNWGQQSLEFIEKYKSYKSKYIKHLKDKDAEKIGRWKIVEMLVESGYAEIKLKSK